MGPFSAGLSKHFTVYAYDRRGRGESTDTKPYAAEREIEDTEALIEEAVGSVCFVWNFFWRCLGVESGRTGTHNVL